ncbi:MAG: hypothetical protein PHY93_18440 [Bacteriovorax sp.]|nr:hypothetical protein [Bacteriovorax sp.]
MPTPNTYDFKNFISIINASGNLFHQTGIANLKNILAVGAIYSPGTLWGINPAIANNYYYGKAGRLQNLKNTSDRGFVDYIFCTFTNQLARQNHTYGTVAIEISKKILPLKEAFIYPFNFKLAWNGAPKTSKFSDLTTWNHIISNMTFPIGHEVLIRRKIDLAKYHVKFHCSGHMSSRVLDIISEFNYNEHHLEVHDDLDQIAMDEMNLERNVEINGHVYKAIINEDGSTASVYDVYSDEDADFLGEFEIEDDKLIQRYPMSDRKEVIGKLQIPHNNSGSQAVTA